MAEITQINESLWTVDVVLPEYSVRGAVIVGAECAVVWDTLTHPHDMDVVKSLIGDKPYRVVYTHADWDHIWGTAGLPDTPQTIIGQTHCHERFEDPDDVSATLAKMQADEPNKWDDVELIAPTVTFESQMTLHLGGITLELHHLPGHTPDCIVGWLREMGILLGGDVMETPLPVVDSAHVVSDWLAMLVQWSQVDTLKQTIPAHGTTTGRDCLDSTINYLRKLLSGDDFLLPDNFDDFYQKTHIKNIKLARDAD